MNENPSFFIEYLPKFILIIVLMIIAFVLLDQFVVQDKLAQRKKAILLERSEIRNREREALNREKSEKAFDNFLSTFAHRAKLMFWLLDAQTQKNLVRAGYRTAAVRGRFLAMRLFSIIGFALGFVLYCVVNDEWSFLPMTPLSAWIGYRMSILVLEQKAKARDAEMAASSSDIVDLLTICVESGMSVELSLQRVAEEIGMRSDVAADELGIVVAELSYLSKRSDAFSNLAQRTGAKAIQNLCIALVQADSFGTSIVSTLRIQSAEARKLRQLEAERQALSIPPKLSVVMVLFFVPIIIIVMLYPAVTKLSGASFTF